MNEFPGLLFNISSTLPQFITSLKELKFSHGEGLASPHSLKNPQFFRFCSSGSFFNSLKAQSSLNLVLPYFLNISLFINSKIFIYKLFFNSSLKHLLKQDSSRSPPGNKNDLLSFYLSF